MLELHAFFDRDVFFKLICCNLWNETLEAFDITHPYRLASAGSHGFSQLLKKANIDQAEKEVIEQRFTQVASSVPELPEKAIIAATSSDAFDKFISVAGIDTGEAILVCIALQFEARNCLITGDKRFVKTLSERCSETFDQIRPRLFTFEECMLAVCDRHGFEFIKQRALPVRTCDGTLRIALGSGAMTEEAAFRDALQQLGVRQSAVIMS